MIAVLLTTAALILIITNRHFNEQTKRYHEDILNRKERAVLTSIDYLLDAHPGEITTDNIIDILDDRVLEITDINKLPIVIYNLKGQVELSTQAEDPRYSTLPKYILDSLNKNDYFKEEIVEPKLNRSYFASYSYIKDIHTLKNVAIVNLPYETNDLFLQDDKSTLMGSYGVAFIFILLLGAIMIYVVSKIHLKN